MELRLPGSGTLGELLRGAVTDIISDTGSYVSTWRDTDRKYDGATPDDVAQAIAFLGEGSLEYVGLADTDAEIQAADVPGGFVLERLLDEEFVPHPDTLSLDQLRAAFLAFLDGDVDCGLSWPEPPPKPEKKKRGLFRRS